MIVTKSGFQKNITTSALALLLGASLMGTSALANPLKSAQTSNDKAAFSEGYTLSEKSTNTQSRSSNTAKLSSFHHQSQNRPQIWISDIGLLLFDDLDGDGYHSGFSITVDVDSEFGDAEVYAKIYLEPSYMSAELLHTTEQFSIYGNTPTDEYRVDTELRNNYTADYYSISIDIHDAWTDELLDTANDRGFSNLRQLPLESGEMNQFDGNNDFFDSEDDYLQDDQHHAGNEGSADVVVTEYAGLFHPALLLLLTGGLFIRRFGRRYWQ